MPPEPEEEGMGVHGSLSFRSQGNRVQKQSRRWQLQWAGWQLQWQLQEVPSLRAEKRGSWRALWAQRLPILWAYREPEDLQSRPKGKDKGGGWRG